MPGTLSAIVPVIWLGSGGKLATASTSRLRKSRSYSVWTAGAPSFVRST